MSEIQELELKALKERVNAMEKIMITLSMHAYKTINGFDKQVLDRQLTEHEYAGYEAEMQAHSLRESGVKP